MLSPHIPRHFVFIAIVVLVAIPVAAWSSPPEDWRILLAVISATLSIFYFLHKQHLEGLRLFKQLFTEFNQRYDALAEPLNCILANKATPTLTADEKQVLYRYFNLCGEEYLFRRHTYILPEAWKAWQRGMCIYYGEPKIRQLWDEELGTGSYYGMRADDLRVSLDKSH